VSLAACGSDPVKPDAMPDAAPRCDPAAPFAAPVPVTGLNTMLDDVSARLSEDELIMVFARRQMTNVYDLYQATREARDAPFGAAELLATVNSVNSELWPTLSPDGLTLMFDSDRGQPGIYHLHVARRTSTADRFGSPAIVNGLRDREVHAYLANANALYFTSATSVRPGMGSDDLWRVEVNADGTLGEPTAIIGGVNTTNEEVAATLTQDELRMYFRRTVAGEPDIFSAQRSTTSDGWGAAVPVPGLSVIGVNEIPTWISPDNCTLYLFSNAPDGAGGYDLYVAYRGSP
jgi:hypothetical protein